MLPDDAHVRTTNKQIDDTTYPTASDNEVQPFDSFWQALGWQQVRARAPLCLKKTLRNRYMLANLVYLGYTIGMLIIDFDSTVNGSTDTVSVNDTTAGSDTTAAPGSVLDQAVDEVPLVNRLYVGFAVVHLISAFLYWWAWHDRTWLDVIMIPEYLNHMESGLYLWSALWYFKEDTFGGYYTMGVHKIELTAATIDIVAAFGWIMSWYLTYKRTLGRGFTLDDPDTIAYLMTTSGAIVYFIYGIQMYVRPEDYNTSTLYKSGDICYFIGACYYIFAALRDDQWFWFLPFAGQYGVAPGSVRYDTKGCLSQDGLPPVLITDLCRRGHIRPEMEQKKSESIELDVDSSIIISFH